jgi:hypothetical protein
VEEERGGEKNENLKFIGDFDGGLSGGDGGEVETGDGVNEGLRPGCLDGVVGGHMGGAGQVQGGGGTDVGFGRVRFDPFCDEVREVLGGISDTLNGCGYVGGDKVGGKWGGDG